MADEKAPPLSGQGGYGATPHPQEGPPQQSYLPAGAAPYPPGQPAGTAPYPRANLLEPPPVSGAAHAFQGEMPQEDVKDDPNMQAPAPSAPPLEVMDVVSGYENVSYSAAASPPPSYDEAMQGEPPERLEFTNVPAITEENARQALLQHVAEHCCYGKAAAQEMTIWELQSSFAFHYFLETFTEARSTCWAYEPYEGQPIDGQEGGPAPDPWDIKATPKAMFKASILDVEVPHTASVKSCGNCSGRGYNRCFRCHGRGRLWCDSCNGTGLELYYEAVHHPHPQPHPDHNRYPRHHRHPYHHRHHPPSPPPSLTPPPQPQPRHRECVWCYGSGRKRCDTCNGSGQVECRLCQTRGSLKCFIKLTIHWKNHTKDHIVERTALPDELIRGVTGKVAFKEEAPRVWPINHFPDQEVNTASNALVVEHSRAFPTERIFMQRQSVRIIPVTQAFYSWRDQQNASFFVYGFERKVYAPDYPQQCCCGCSIL